MGRAVKTLRRWLYLGHRWLGILTCLLFAIWFVSGVVMIYVGFPGLSEVERRAGLPALDWGAVRVTPTRALEVAGAERFPRDLRLVMLDAEPVYRITEWSGARRTVSAADGHPIAKVGEDEAVRVAGHDPRASHPRIADRVERDQWTVTARYDPLRPFHLVALNDAAGTNLYVSARTGEVALDTTRTERVWNWLGAIPHWIYLTPLRAQAELWRDVVLWVSGVSIAAAVSGFWIGILRVRPRRGYGHGRASPYRGWAAWHHWAGLVGGLTLITFIVSGWLSMNPNRWFGPRAPTPAMLERYAGATVPRLDLDLAQVRAATCPDAVEVRLGHLDGRSLAVTACRDGRAIPCCTADALSPERVAGAARHLMPEADAPTLALLSEEDAYWYAHHQPRRLPVLRVRFADPDATWFHIDPGTGEILNRMDRSARAYRWLFNGLHTLDFGALLRHRPVWDVLVWLLSAIGLVTSVSGVVIGWRRLGATRPRRRLARGEAASGGARPADAA